MTTDKVMRRTLLTAPQTIEYDEVPLGTPEPDEVLVKIAACAICTWEKRTYTGADTRFYPLIAGHEISGVVEAIGENAGTGGRCGRHGCLRFTCGTTSVGFPRGGAAL